MNAAAGHTGERERALRQILRLVDLSLDLERNNDDRAFREDGGKIIYVLDQNIFEMFVRPWKHRESVETFYSDVWADSAQGNAAWPDYEAQAALIASELLVSRILPGARHDQIMMTEAHRYELAHRHERIRSKLRQIFQEDPKAVEVAYADKLKQLEEVVALSHGSQSAPKQAEVGEQLGKDLAKLAETMPAAVLDRVRVARRAASFLAADPVTEPLDQLRRITSGEIRNRLHTLQHFRTPDNAAISAIEKDAEVWIDRLVEELRRPGNRHRTRAEDIDANPRAHGQALRNDARSIAFLHWFATRAIKEGERLVFITGDLVMFDAYRRWHSGPDAGDTAKGPFFMRRATQYSPIFNPDDSATDLGGARSQVFSQVERAIEGALLPFVFSSPESAQSDLSSLRRREMLALKLIDVDAVEGDRDVATMLGEEPGKRIADFSEAIGSIRAQWQEAERLAIGASYDLISGRLSDEQLALVRDIATQSPDEVAPALNQYITRLFDRLVDDSMQLWLPLAQSFGSDEEQTRKRRLRVAMETTPPSPQSSSESVFAFAAARALELQDVSNAHRFSGLALRADYAARAREGDQGVNLELEYLNAVTYRFQIATVGEQYRKDMGSPEAKLAASRAIDEVKVYFARASRLVHRAVSAHAEAHMDQQSYWDGVRYMRALSERAALNLFVACALGLARVPHATALVADAERHVSIAKGDLYWCLDIDRALAGEGEDFILGRVRAQVGANIAAAEVLAYILSKGKRYRYDERLREREREIKPHINAVRGQPADQHPLLRAELMAYAILSGERVRYQSSAGRPSLSERDALKLPLDRELFTAIVKRVL